MDVSTVTLAQPRAAAPSKPVAAAAARHSKRADFLIAVSFLGDATMIMLGMMIGFWVRFVSGWIPVSPGVKIPQMENYSTLMLVGTGFFLATFLHLGLYDHRHLLRFRRTGLIMLKSSIFWFCAYLGTSLALKFDPPISRIYASVSVVSCFSVLVLWRFLFAQLVQSETIACHLRQKVLLVGWTGDAHRLAAAIQEDPSHPYEIVGCVSSPHGVFRSDPMPGIKVLGDFDDINDLIKVGGVNILVVTDPELPNDKTMELNELCEREYIQFKKIPSYFQILVSGLQLETISGVPILGVTELPLDKLMNRFFKRTVDIVGALVGLCLSVPLVAILGAIVYLQSPGPIFYRQTRTGRNGQDFRIIKIRSMRLDAEADSGARWAQKDDPRRLPIGAFMREWNLDEIPQFWNVLKGDMSLVGPRPERPELIERFKTEIPHYNARHASKPGLTGWAQVHGLRGDTDLNMRVQYDLFYLENWSLFMDFQIMIMTFINRKNAY